MIVKTACEHSTGLVFSYINFNLSLGDVLDKMSVKFETGLCEINKIRSLGKIIASCVVRRQQLALKAYFSYTPGPVDWKLGRKHWGDL